MVQFLSSLDKVTVNSLRGNDVKSKDAFNCVAYCRLLSVRLDYKSKRERSVFRFLIYKLVIHTGGHLNSGTCGI